MQLGSHKLTPMLVASLLMALACGTAQAYRTRGTAIEAPSSARSRPTSRRPAVGPPAGDLGDSFKGYRGGRYVAAPAAPDQAEAGRILGGRIRRPVTRDAGGRAAAPAEEFLDRAVLQGMEADHRQAAAGRQDLFGGPQAAAQFAQFVVDPDAQREKGARRGIDTVA